MKRAALRAKRDTPRRNEGRVQHKRTKARGRTTEEAQHVVHVAGLGCLICGQPANVHHVMRAPGKRRRRDDRFVVPLCREHHQGDSGVHGLGSEAAFLALWGVDLAAWAVSAWTLRDAPGDPFWRDGVTRMRAIALPRLLAHEGGGGKARRTNNGLSTPPYPTP